MALHGQGKPLRGAASLVLLTLLPATAIAFQGRVVDGPLGDDPVSLLFTRAEVRQVDSLEDEEARRRFVARFWERRDPDPATVANEFREIFNERVAYADKQFGGRFSGPGWKTVPGFLVVVLGPPDEVVETTPRYIYDGSLQSLVIWRYRNVAGRPLTIPLVDAKKGLKLAIGPRQKDMARALRRRLDEARLHQVRRAEAARLDASVVELDSSHLPGRMASACTAERLLAELTIPLEELFGEPADRGVRFRFAIDVGDQASGDGAGELELLVAADELQGRLRGELHLAIGIPRSVVPEGTATDVRITETTTGRSALVSFHDPRGDEGKKTLDGHAPEPPDLGNPGCEPARRAISAGAEERGVAVLYLTPCKPDDDPAVTTVIPG